MKIYLGNAYVRIVSEFAADAEVFSQIKKYFRVKVKGANFSHQFKTGVWDGYKHFVVRDKLHAGLFEQLLVFLERIEFKAYVIEDVRTNIPKFKGVPEIIGGIQLRGYQVEACNNVNRHINDGNIYFPRGIVNAATNAGKSLIALGIYCSYDKAKMLFVVHSKSIFDQMYKDFDAVFPGKVGKICSGKNSVNTIDIKPITIAMNKSFSNALSKQETLLETVNEYFNILIVDEVHHTGAADYVSLLSVLDMPVRVGLSGTPLSNEDIVKNTYIIGLFGKEIIKISNDFLIDSNISRKPIINMCFNDYVNNLTDVDKEELTKGPTYTEYYKTLVINSPMRLTVIRSIITNNPGKKILITFTQNTHGDAMFRYLTMLHKDLVIRCINGLSEDRSDVIAEFNRGELDILLTSIILKEGINLPNIDIMIMAHGGKSKITTLQFLGRALRAKIDSNEVAIYDFYDNGDYVSAHSKQRIDLYEAEGFIIKPDYECVGDDPRKPVKK